MISAATGLAYSGLFAAGKDAGPKISGSVGSKSAAKAERPNILFAIADDWSWPHAGAYGDEVVKTPTFDRLARQGVLFTNAFCCAPTCTASRGGILTGQAIHKLKEGANLWSILRAEFPVYPDLLEAAGYHVGLTGKGWGPGTLEGSGRKRNPAGPSYVSFKDFMADVPPDKPFCYWFGSRYPHRAYKAGSGIASGLEPDRVRVPPFLPDTPEVRSDILDYYSAVQQFDLEMADILECLDRSGRAENTIVVMTSDNGMPFPRAKANLYEAGIHTPLVIRWPARVKGDRIEESLISATDFAPTFLEAAGLKPLPEMTGQSFLDLLLLDQSAAAGGVRKREAIFVERERHAYARRDNLSYPSRAIRTQRFLYIRNLRPERWPAGDPDWQGSQGTFADIDRSPSKDVLIQNKDNPDIKPFFRLACEKRPEEELYDLVKDPWCVKDVAALPEYAAEKRELRKELERWMKDTGDPRASGGGDEWDRCPYYGQPR